MQIFYYDKDYMYLYEDVIEDSMNMPENVTDVQPVGFYLPKFDPKKKAWYESASKEYIESLQPKPQPSALEIMENQITELYYLLAIGNGGDSS